MSEEKRYKTLPCDDPVLADMKSEGAKMELEIIEHRLKNDPSASNWLKEQLDSTRERDVVDALSDETLHNILQLRLASIGSITKTAPGE